MTETAQRWRLVLGRHAESHLSADGIEDEDAALDFLYGREYAARGLPDVNGTGWGVGRERPLPHPVDWLQALDHLFPRKTCERLRSDAIERYQIPELLIDANALGSIPASTDTLRALLALQGHADPVLKAQIRAAAQRIIDDLLDKLKVRMERAFSGRRDRQRRSLHPRTANFDPRRTLRDNLNGWDPEAQRLLAERLRFHARIKRHLPLDVILCVDQSGSMSDSMIHSAVVAAVLTGLAGITPRMVLFDTRVVDVSEVLADPLETLLSVQLGGGTDIGRAVAYCQDLVQTPDRTVFLLVSDLFEGGARDGLEAGIARLVEARVRCLGLTALDDAGRAYFDREMAERLAGLGMEVAAMTPDALAAWLAEAMQ